MMALPVVETPIYYMNLLSNGTQVKYRPFTVKEEKVLMIALESRDIKQIIDAIYQVLEACTFNDIKVRDLATFDLESLFINIRAKSVGENLDLAFACEECNHVNKNTHDVTDYYVEGEVKDNKVTITDSIGFVLKYPSLNDIKDILDFDNPDAGQVIKIASKSIEYIYDEEQIYRSEETDPQELVEFVEQLSSKQFREIENFVRDIPRLKKDVSFVCESCGTNNEIIIEGIQGFFTSASPMTT